MSGLSRETQDGGQLTSGTVTVEKLVVEKDLRLHPHSSVQNEILSSEQLKL